MPDVAVIVAQAVDGMLELSPNHTRLRQAQTGYSLWSIQERTYLVPCIIESTFKKKSILSNCARKEKIYSWFS
jgi:hypothetical protein